ncbi:dipeptide/oligopeptide/nickel ABC transporter permease/ATP-binding protein [Paenibacillus thiaminolyticus]|nr:dipeptide/oligopeptide/nickel ABC transporter permease/ATP-binding protein [Paenibacillus thiaminolyticus]MCY9537225.1 dipeptide/oligopeptide/nickel ABC transporter permease/ATP-binding protein [Paenibacillus thiaminolyticus]MCY9614787.1 dipeptide/oligopeptide/nickel ABC transporter permease/ATP-binding protein [Paenibacillus thiaminolyticus]MCY9619921.1 dipeptide/oligopeptide/nickel ABC transporter permease/ATP-binding protein [Paenibacillus thiaminolyticus]MCY9623154.1 dipeptide/oligopepti
MMNPTKMAGIVIIACFVVLALAGPLLANADPFAFDHDRLLAPSSANWLGTNALGQDVFSQLSYGARATFLIGLGVALLSTALSGMLGLAAGYVRRLDPLINGLANVLLVLPSLLLVLLVAAFTAGGVWQLIITLGLLTWPGYMRLIRSSVLSLREREFVKASQLFHGTPFYILRKHLMPFIVPLLRTKFILSFRQAVTMEASLSFLGLGDPNQPTWGKMLEQAFHNNETWMTAAWQWTIVPPMLALLLVTIGLALVSEGEHQQGSSWLRSFRPSSKVKPRRAEPRPSRAAEPDEPAVEVHDLSVVHQGRTILQPMSFAVRAGSITAIIGESGSGKTTLARAVYGLLPDEAMSGSVYIRGGGSAEQGLNRWVDAAFIAQDPRLSFHPLLTIGQQFMEAMKGRGTSKADVAGKRLAAEQAMREVQLPERLLDSYPHELSGGMLGRALIALALINKPALLIADEPTSALDPLIKREIFRLLIEKVRAHGMTLLLITHDVPSALRAADDVMIIKEGQLVEHASVEKWLQKPATSYSRELQTFIPSMR